MGKQRKNLLGLLLCISGVSWAGTDSKKAHLSNEWYPTDPQKLKKKLYELDTEAEKLYEAQVSGVKALIVPHAGLRYSGSLAAGCFRLLDPKKVRRIILLAPSHTLPFKGIILPSYSSYRLHSGVIPLDAKMVQELKKSGAPFTMVSHAKKDPHYKEHALEIELPLIQKYAPRAKIVPLIVGTLDSQEMQCAAHLLKKYLDKETVVVVSSDFTHYGPRFNNLPFKNDALALLRIRALDNGFLQPIFNRSLPHFVEKVVEGEATICGKNPLSLLLALFDEGLCKQEVPYLIGYDTSRTAGTDEDNSVSYVGLAFGKPHMGPLPLLTAYEKRSLVELAQRVMVNNFTHALTQDLLCPIITPTLQQPAHLFLSCKTSAPVGCKVIEKKDDFSPSLYLAVMKQAEAVCASHASGQTSLTYADLGDMAIQISVIAKKTHGLGRNKKVLLAESKLSSTRSDNCLA